MLSHQWYSELRPEYNLLHLGWAIVSNFPAYPQIIYFNVKFLNSKYNGDNNSSNKVVNLIRKENFIIEIKNKINQTTI
jgi:hypothetical protein